MIKWYKRKQILKDNDWQYTRIGHDNFYTYGSNIYFVEDLRTMDDEEFNCIIEDNKW